MIVERATEDDFSGLLAVDAAHHNTADLDPTLAQQLGQAVRQRQVIIARQGEDIVGYAIVHRTFFNQWFTATLLVHPGFRRQQVATQLMRYVEKTCPEPKLFTSTNQSNLPMQRLCEKLGYVASGIIYNLDDDDPELIYFKALP